MGIADIDESAEDDSKAGETTCYVQAKPTSDVVLACPGDVFLFTVVRKELSRTNLEEEVEVEIYSDDIDKEMNGQQKVDETQFLSLLEESP